MVYTGTIPVRSTELIELSALGVLGLLLLQTTLQPSRSKCGNNGEMYVSQDQEGSGERIVQWTVVAF